MSVRVNIASYVVYLIILQLNDLYFLNCILIFPLFE